MKHQQHDVNRHCCKRQDHQHDVNRRCERQALTRKSICRLESVLEGNGFHRTRGHERARTYRGHQRVQWRHGQCRHSPLWSYDATAIATPSMLSRIPLLFVTLVALATAETTKAEVRMHKEYAEFVRAAQAPSAGNIQRPPHFITLGHDV